MQEQEKNWDDIQNRNLASWVASVLVLIIVEHKQNTESD